MKDLKEQRSEVHKRHDKPDSPKGGKMDADEFGRLKSAQRRENLNKLV